MTLMIELLRRFLPASPLPVTRPLPRALPSAAQPVRADGSARRPASPRRGTRCENRLYVIRSGSSDARRGVPDARIILSGGIDAVCAELERLAALEKRHH